ncbi:hypothetical protein E4U60_006103, partial [Claviceps pazoutovae]
WNSSSFPSHSSVYFIGEPVGLCEWQGGNTLCIRKWRRRRGVGVRASGRIRAKSTQRWMKFVGIFIIFGVRSIPPSALFGLDNSSEDGLITHVFLHDRIRPGPCRSPYITQIWVSHQEEVPEDVIRVRTGQIRHGNVLANREFGAPALEDGSPPLYSDDDESPPEYDVTAFLGSPLYRLHNGMLLDIHHAALQADDFIRYYGDYDDGDIEQAKGPKTGPHFNEQGDLVTDDGNDRPASLQQQFKPRVYVTLADFFQQLQAPLQITPSI